MSSSRKKPVVPLQEKFMAMIDRWPRVWAFEEAKDKKAGKALVELLRPFIVHLCEQDLSPKTKRQHLYNTWLIGGEIIRDVQYYPEHRRWSARRMLNEAIMEGEAPLCRHVDEAGQRSLDSTAKKICKFLASQDQA